jgi:hypothetical protein
MSNTHSSKGSSSKVQLKDPTDQPEARLAAIQDITQSNLKEPLKKKLIADVTNNDHKAFANDEADAVIQSMMDSVGDDAARGASV